MITEILNRLPDDARADLALRPIKQLVTQFNMGAHSDERLVGLDQLASMNPNEALDIVGRATAYGAFLAELVVLATALEKRLTSLHCVRAAQVRAAARSENKAASNAALDDLVTIDSWLRAVDDGIQSFAEVKGWLEQRERACTAAAVAASRAITAKQVELKQFELEVRRG